MDKFKLHQKVKYGGYVFEIVEFLPYRSALVKAGKVTKKVCIDNLKVV